MLYLCEASSEHPLAKAMVEKVLSEKKDAAKQK